MFKQRYLTAVVIFLLSIFCISNLVSAEKSMKEKKEPQSKMIVISNGIVNGIIGEKYGTYAKQFIKGMPTYSLPLNIQEYPKETKTFAIIMEDKDAIPVVGFSWLHWSVANLTRNALEENSSTNATDFAQGTNSWSSIFLEKPLDRYEAAQYGGPTPPDKAHTYEIHVFALDSILPLENGFYVNDLYHEMEGHILAQYTLKAVYNK